MMNKLITFKLFFRSIARLFLFMVSTELSCTFCFSCSFYNISQQRNNAESLGTIWLNIVGAWKMQNKISKAYFTCIKNDLIDIAQFPRAISIVFDSPLFQKFLQTSGAKLFMHYSKCLCPFKFRTRNNRCKVCRSKQCFQITFDRKTLVALFHGTSFLLFQISSG